MVISARRRALIWLATIAALALTGVAASPAAAFTSGASISGVVVGAGVDATVIAGAQVTVYRSDSTLSAGWATTASDGTFTIANLQAGDYRVAVRQIRHSTPSRWVDVPTIASWSPTEAELAALPIVSVGDGEQKTEVNVTLPLRPVISGVIYGSTGGVTAPVAGATVYVSNTNVREGFFATSGTDGAFAVPVAAGNNSYRISVSAAGYAYAQDALIVDVADADATGADVTLVRGASISGRVSAAPGTVLPGSSVQVAVRDQANRTVTASGVRADGTFTVDVIPPGSYRISFVADFDMPSRQQLGWWQNASTFEEATIITVEDGENIAGIDLVFGTTPPEEATPKNLTKAQTVAAGGFVSVAAEGFEPGESIEAWLQSTPVKLGTLVADADGSITASVAVPATTPAGLHHLVLVDGEGTEYTSEDITVTAAFASAASAAASAAATAAAATEARLATTGQDPAPAGLIAGLMLVVGIGALALRRMKPVAAVARARASRRS